MKYSMIDFRVLGPNGKPYLNLAQELEPEFKNNGVIINTPIMLSEPSVTTVFITIGIGVAIHLINKLVDKLIKIFEIEKHPNTTINIQINQINKIYKLPKEKKELLEEYPKDNS
jgi:hypothetical protein